MATKIYNYAPNEIKPAVDFELSRSREGLWTCSQVFTCRYTDYGNVEISDRLKKGTPITDLNFNIPARFSFITLRSQRFQHKPGGITEIHCDFSGAQDDDGYQGPSSDRSTSISYRGVISQAPIIEHPVFIAETSNSERAAIRGLYYEQAHIFNQGPPGSWLGDGVRIRKKKDDDDYGVQVITSPSAIWWIDLIHVQGVKYYDRPQIEYTVTQTNKDGITQEELDNYGRAVDTPPENPIVPSWFEIANAEDPPRAWWHFSGVTEDRDENSSVYSRTYTMRDDVYRQRLYDVDYEPTEPSAEPT